MNRNNPDVPNRSRSGYEITPLSEEERAKRADRVEALLREHHHRVRNTFHFEYADGTPHYDVGTTCYAWVHQGDALEEQTLATLKHAPFNKLRMCIFPKHYAYNENEPVTYPFAGTPPRDWDFTRFD